LFGKSTPAILAIIYLLFFVLKLLSLTHLEFRSLLADYVEMSFATDDLAIIATLFDGCLDFHISKILFVPEGYPTLC
jgi:hypothetical protein